ncbi:MAG: CehA/McbA family metallohydrolase [Candidatus Poribacteria bacterium]
MPKITRKERLKQIAQRRDTYTTRVFMLWKDVMRERVEQTSKIVSFNFYRGDLHYHSTYSDGVATVQETKEWVDRAGLDFFFVTDHGTVNQKRICQKYENLWWGQEPGTQYHHLGILGLDRKYTPKRDLAYDYHKVKEFGAYPFIPHPAGWFPTTRYSDEQKDALNLLGDEFAIEIINGANQVFDCFDITDEMSIELWDKHLCRGKRVTGLGNTDAHLPQAIGDVWTAVFCEPLTKENVIDALWKGHCFASDAPLVNIALNGAQMGDVVYLPAGASAALHYECADSRGLEEIRIIKDGECIENISPSGDVKAEDTIDIQFDGSKSYCRLECFALDQRRAYSNPIYIWES